MRVSWKDTCYCIYADVYRNTGGYSKKTLVKHFFSENSTVSFLIHYRLCRYFANKKRNIIELLLHSILYYEFKKKQIKLGIELNQHTEIGSGLRLPHRGTIVIHPLSKIGNNCEIMQSVTIGNNVLKSRTGVAKIGNNVIIGAGAKIIGEVVIGNNIIVGANAVVTHDITDNCTVGDSPAKKISILKKIEAINSNY